MTLTRATFEQLLLRRLSGLMSEAGMDVISNLGNNPDLNDPIGWAIRQCSGTVADFTTVANTDVATVAAADYDKLLDLAEYRTLQSISGNLAVVDIQVGSRRESLDQLVERVEARIARKLKQLQQDYGFSLGTLEAGVIGLDFMQTLDCPR